MTVRPRRNRGDLKTTQEKSSCHPSPLVAVGTERRGASQNETLKARIYDPLWLLAREWQLGELGRQWHAGFRTIARRMRRTHAVLPQGGAARPVVRSEEGALETFVEREAVHPEPGALVRLRVCRSRSAILRCWGMRHSARNTIKVSRGVPLPARSAALAADVDGEALRFWT